MLRALRLLLHTPPSAFPRGLRDDSSLPLRRNVFRRQATLLPHSALTLQVRAPLDALERVARTRSRSRGPRIRGSTPPSLCSPSLQTILTALAASLTQLARAEHRRSRARLRTLARGACRFLQPFNEHDPRTQPRLCTSPSTTSPLQRPTPEGAALTSPARGASRALTHSAEPRLGTAWRPLSPDTANRELKVSRPASRRA